MRLVLALLVLLTACSRPPPPGPPGRQELGPDIAAPDPSVGCNMRVETPWRGAAGFHIIVDAIGVTCPESSISITIAGPNGSTRMAANYPIAQLTQVFGMAPAQVDRSNLEAALRRWIDPNAPERRLAATIDLPEWEHRQAEPQDNARAYTPSPGFGRASFEVLRQDRRPLFCYQAASGTLRCYAMLADGSVQLVAVGHPPT